MGQLAKMNMARLLPHSAYGKEMVVTVYVKHEHKTMNFHMVKSRHLIAFCSRLLSKRYLHACSIFLHNLEQRQKVFARSYVENHSIEHKTLQYAFAA